MPHYRQTIRDAVADVLHGNTAAGENVFTSRARPVLEILQKRELVLSVYTADEASKRNGDSYLLNRGLVVSIEGMAGGGDDIDDVLDSLAQQVEDLIDADPMLSNLLSEEMVLVSTSSEITARGNQQVGAFRMDYECAYQTNRQRTGYMPGDNPDDVIPTPPLPNLVVTSGHPTAVGYVSTITDDYLRCNPLPMPDPDETDEDHLPIEQQDNAIRMMDEDLLITQPTETGCEDGACDNPVWGGER